MSAGLVLVLALLAGTGEATGAAGATPRQAPAVLVLAEPVQRGQELRPEVLALAQDGNPTDMPVAYLGRLARRHLPRGTTVTLRDFAPPPVILRNDTVTVQVRRGSLVVSMQGRALADAAPGESVRILNREAGRSIDGIAVAAGLVQVVLP